MADARLSLIRVSMRIAAENGLRTIAFPAIRCEAYRYPIPNAAQIAVKTALKSLRDKASITKVTSLSQATKSKQPISAFSANAPRLSS